MVPSLPLLSCESSVSVKKTLIEKKQKNTLKKFVANLPTNCLSVFAPFVELALKGLSLIM